MGVTVGGYSAPTFCSWENLSRRYSHCDRLKLLLRLPSALPESERLPASEGGTRGEWSSPILFGE